VLTLPRLARLRYVSLFCVVQIAFLPFLSFDLYAQSAPHPNQIIPDGRTATSLQTSGNVTNVTTSTVSGPNAFNSFSQFGVGQGNTVNLQLPGGTQNLINVVRDAPAYVNGTLNSYANGKIGGNVYFADPQGFVVGPTGTVNVGSLNVSTPTREFTEKLIGAQGQINGDAVNSLMNGSFPISPDGNIRILGRVNAADGVRLTGQNVYVGGAMSQRDLINQDHAAKFAASVNSKGLRSASGIVVSNGSIHIVAAGNAKISGRLTARSRGTTPSTITVAAGKNLVLGKNARLSTASKTGDGGDILLKAANNLTVKPGARIDASSAVGNAGLVDLSANGRFTIGDHVKINLAAPNGKAGTLLMDPTDIVIGAAGDSGVTLSNTTIANAIAALSTGATYTLQADNSITLNADAVIDTRRLDASGHTTANAFNVELDAPTITMAQGAEILAQAVNHGGSTWTDGSVTLNATATQTLLSGQASATTGITVDGTITGGAITIGASSTTTSSFTSSVAGDFALVGESLAPSFLGLNGGYVAASSTATVAINGHASITGSGSVSITATGSEDAEDPVIASALAGLSPVGASVVVGNISATVSNTVASGATISAGGSLTFNATNSATLNVAAVAATSSAVFVATVAYSQVNVNTTANIQTGAHLNAGTAGGANKGLSVIAVNNNSFSTTATAIALSSLNTTGGVGGALAISNVDTAVTATLGASLGSSASNRMAGDVVVEATSYGIKNATQASVTVGTPAIVGAIQAAMPVSIMTQQMTSLFPADLGLKAAAALSLATSSENATASIAQNPSGGAPSIYATGNVAVISDVVDQGVRSNATSSAIATDPLTGESVAIAVAVAWGTFSHNSNAYVGDGVLINASKVGVAATTYLPITNTWLEWDGLSQVLSHLNGTLGIGGNIMTSYASASADAGDTVGLAGAIGRFTVNNNTTAWVAIGATLVSTSTDTTGWSVPLHGSGSSPQSFTDNLQILASATTDSIDAAGNIGALGWIGNSSGGSSFGGAINLIQTNSNTIAGVSSGASLTSATDVAVDATTTDLFFGVSPTSGKAAGALALNGITSIALVDNTTHASISDQALVNAPSVSIDAAENLSALSVAGSVVLGGSSGVGLAVAYLGANTDTSAYVGDNHGDITPGVFSANDPYAGNGGGSGSINTDNLSVDATTSGRMTAVSIAAAISEPSVSDFASKASAVGGAATGGAAGAGLAASKITAGSGASSDGFSIDAAGSSSVTDVALATSAYIHNTTINRFTTTATTAKTSVQALNDTILDNGSGSASLNLAGSSASQSVAVGGAISVGMSNNATQAYISGTTIYNQESVTVQALTGGQETIVAIAIAASRANSASLSGSAGIITDSTTAYIANSTLSGVSGSSGAIAVDAYQTSDIAIGGGSLYLAGGQGGVGVAMTYASVADPSSGNAVDAHISATSISNYDTIAVLADNASVIAAGAASGGAGGNGAAGAIIVDQITPTTTAYISSTSTVTISVTGAVGVTADSVDVSSLDTALANLVKPTSNGQLATDNCSSSSGSQSCIDFTAAALNGGTGNAPGASIISVAGIIQAGKNNVGAALVFDTIATTHSAYIADVLLTSTSGDVAVAASDSSQIQSVTIGFGLATGQFAGVGGTTVSNINNTVSAAVGDSRSTTTRSTISAAGLSVTATDRSKITGTAAVGGASTQGSAAGLAIVYSNISNNVSAGVTGSKVAVTGDVAVNAGSTGTISTVAVGVALSSQVGLAGSVATNLMGTNVTADITGGADVTANDNVSVLASNSDNAAVFAGAFAISKGAAGGAGSLVTNKITGSTSAYIDGSTTKVDAQGTSSSDTLSVNGGTLANAVNLGSFSAPTDNTPDLTENQDTVKGLAVVASSHQAVVTNVASLAASSGVSIMVNPIVNVMAGATNAYIDSASIDTRLTSTTPAPQIDVAASSFSYSGAFGLGIVAPTGTAGGGATIISTTMERTTQAYIVNATVGNLVSSSAAVGAVTVKANAEQDASSVAVGFNSGSVGLNVFNATTEAYVDGGSITGRSLTVNAKDSTGIASANGSGAYGRSVAIGAAFLVQVSANRTEAYVGDEFHYEGNGAANSTTVRLSGALDVEANTTDNFQAYSVGGALSTGSAAVAGMANIEIANNTTIAGLYDTNVQSPTGGTAGAVTVNAAENVTIMEIAGALAIGASGGGVGVGAAANVIVFKSQTIAETRNSNLDSSGTIDVSAESTKEVVSYAVTAGVGGSVGIGATVGVIIIGTNTADSATQGKENGQLDGTVGAANSGTNSSQGSGAVASGSAGDPSTANASSTYDVSSVLTGGNDGVAAQIAGGNVTGSEVDVGATSAASAQMFLLGAGFGKNVGVGAAIGYATVDSSVLANLSAIVVAPTVNVGATVMDPTGGSHPGRTVNIQSVAGGGALYFGGDAAVASGYVGNTVNAEVGGSISGPTGNAPVVNVVANDTSTQSAQTEGASIGIAAVGASVTTAKKTSSVTAQVLANTTINANMASVSASDSGLLSAYSVAVSGGILTGNGSAATATDVATVTAKIGASSSVTTSGGLSVTATDTPDAEANALGVVAGGAAVGASVALASVSSTVSAQVLDSVTLAGAGAVTIAAYGDVPSDGNAAYTNAIGAVGAALVGVQATVSIASDSSNVSATIGDSVTLPAGNVSVLAENTTSQSANATGIAASGFLAIGVVVTQASSGATTTASLGDSATAASAGSLAISAIGTDNNYAHAISGSGGEIAGSGAASTTADNSTVTAGIGDNNGTRGNGATADTPLNVASLAILATHTDNYTTIADTTQAAGLGASGATATHSANSTVIAGIGTGNTIAVRGTSPGHCDVADCASALTISANNIFNEVGTSSSANAGAGGGINGVGATSDITLNGTATANIGTNTHITSGTDTVQNPGSVTVLATTTITGTDRVTLITGGGIEGAGVSSSLHANVDDDVNIGAPSAIYSGSYTTPSSAASDQVQITSFGSIGIGTYTQTTANTSSYANTFGIAFVAAVATATTDINTNQNIVVGASVLTAFDNVNVTAGQDPSGSHSTYMADDASAISFARGLIAVPAANATASLNNNTSVNIAVGASLNSGENIVTGGYGGSLQPTATGTGHGYELGFIPASDGSSNPSATTHAELTINGTLTAGIYNNLSITIACDYSAACLSAAPGGAPFSASYTNVFNGTTFVDTYFDPEVQNTLINGLSGSTNAFSLGQLFASGGTVTLNADHITGGGNVTANGSPTISVNNASDANLILAGGAYIPVSAAGDIFFTGAASGFASGSSPQLQSNPSGIATIAINNSYNPAVNPPAVGPALLIVGDITNVNGLVAVNNTLGSYGLSANLTGQQVNITVPNGSVAVSANDPSGMYIAGGSPFSEWLNFMVWPGGNPGSAAPSGDLAAAYLANTMFPGFPGLSDSLNGALLNARLYGTVGSVNNGTSHEFFGGCAYQVSNDCNTVYLSPITTWPATAVSNTVTYDFNPGNSNDAFFPIVRYYSLNKSTNASQTVAQQYAQANLTGSQNSFQIYGGQVAIKASIINVNGSITAGRQTNYNIYLDPSLTAPAVVNTQTTTTTSNSSGCFFNPTGPGCTTTTTTTTVSGGDISVFQYNYDQAVLTNPTANSVLVIQNDQFGNPLVTYNAATNQISVANINASSGGGSVLLDGKIISTNPLGNIHVNGGYGNVAVDNQTGLDLLINGVNTGNTLAAAALTSTVTIIDRNISSGNNTSTYVYSPATNAIDLYKTNNGAIPNTGSCSGANNCTVVGGSAGSYDPVSGLRFQWVQQANISRADNGNGTHWTFSGDVNHPWSYVASDGSLSTTPQGVVTTGNSSGMPVFQETITGSVTNSSTTGVGYHGCNGTDSASTCHFGFKYTPGCDTGDGVACGQWNYEYELGGRLTLTSSVKADNRFGINFGGNATGAVSITSNGNVIFAGSIINPNGSLGVSASSQQQLFGVTTGGNIAQTANGSILTQSAALAASGGIGTRAAPIRATLANSGSAPGSLSARAGTAGVYLNLASGATLNQVSSGNTTTGFGDINITAIGDLVAGTNAQVIGRNITLISTGGGVGSIANPLPISANAALQADGSYDGGVVNVIAHGDIGLTQTAASPAYSNDLRVGLIASAAGDVVLNVPYGTILDASGQTATQTLTSAQVAAVSTALHLTAIDDATGSALASVIAFDNNVNRDLALYTTMLQHGAVQTGSGALTAAGLASFAVAALSSSDYTTFQSLTASANATIANGVLTLTANGLTQFKAAAASALGVASPTTAQIQNYANGLYQTYAQAIQNYSNAQGTFVLANDAKSIAMYASGALTSSDYATFQNLTVTYGSVTGGVVTLTSAGIAQFRAAAATALGVANPTDAQVQTYANTLYQGFATTVQAYAPTLYQSFVTVLGQAYGSNWKTNSQVTNYASSSSAFLTLNSYGQVTNGVFALGSGAVGDAGVANYAAAGLSSSQYSIFQNLTSAANGSVSNGTLTLTPAGVTFFTAAAATALGIASPTAAQVQSYANGLYQGYAQTIHGYASSLYQTLQTATTFNATPAVAFSLLSTSGSLQNGAFVLTNSGLLSYAKSALSSANYGLFSNLLTNGSLSGGTFQLSSNGVSALAQTALTQDYQNFQTLYTDGSLVNGVFTLNAAGLAAFRQAASTTQNPNPTDAQVQAFANALYQTYATTINGAANTQYQGFVTSINSAASTSFLNYATELLGVYNGPNNPNPITLSQLFGPNALVQPNQVIPFLQQMLYGIPAADRTGFQNLIALGSVQTGGFVLNAGSVATYAPTGLSAANFNAYSALLGAGTVTNGVLTLNLAGLNAFAQTTLTPNYQSYVSLTGSGAVQYGTYMFSNAGVQSNAQAGVNAAYSSFQQLVADGTVTSGVLTLSSSGLAAYTAIAAAALGIANPTSAQVQAYANQQYQSSLFSAANPTYQAYAQTIRSDAQSQYTSFANAVYAYLLTQQQSCGLGCNNPVVSPGQTTATDAQVQQYAGQVLSPTQYQTFQALLSNGSVNNGVLTLTNAGLSPVAAQVLPASLATAFNNLLTTGSLQGGQFVLSTATVLQNLQTLAANGAGSGGLFQFNSAGILTYAPTALGSGGLQQLLSSGAVQSATVNGVTTSNFVLNDAGVAYYAPGVLTPANYLTFEGLTASANGEVVNGVLTLSAAGTAQFTSAAAASLHVTNPSSAQVQAYANGQYQNFATAIRTYANGQYQGYGTTFQTYASGQFQSLQQTVLNYAGFNLSISIDRTNYTFTPNCQIFCGGVNSSPITNAQLATWAQQANAAHFLSDGDYASFTALLGQGTAQAAGLTLTSASLQSYYSNLASSSAALNSVYQAFQQIVAPGNSTIQNGALVLTSAGITNVALAAAAFLGPNPTDAQVQAFASQAYVADLASIQSFAATQYQSYAAPINAYGNGQYQNLIQTVQNYANSQYQADAATIQGYANTQYQTLTANGAPQVSAGILSLVSNSVYSSGQIVSALSTAALLPSAGSVGTNATANIVGRNVTLSAAGSVGSTAPNVVIGITDLKNGTITTTQQAALSVATTPGSITFDATISAAALASLDLAHLPAGVTISGNTVSGLTLGSLPNGITVNDLTNVELSQTAPLYVSSSGTFSATAGTTVYIQAAASAGQPVATLTVGQINAGGDVTLLAPQSILTATNSSGTPLFANQIVINPINNAIGNLTLAATNAIGSAAAALSYHINGKLISAQAGTDAYLTATGGDATFGKLFATDTVSLTATNGNIFSYLPGVTMAANNIILNASGDVGTLANPFTLQVGATGLLSGTVAGAAYIYSPTIQTQNPVSLNVGNLAATNGLTLISDAGISFGGAASSSLGSVTVCSGPCVPGSTAPGGAITMNANSSIQAAQLISLTAPGDIVLGQLTSTDSPASTVSVITVTSTGGSIKANGDGHTNLVATAAHAEVTLSANSSIGTSSQRVAVNTPLLAPTTAGGSIYLGAASDLHASLLSAINGSVDVLGSGKLTLDSVLAGTAPGANGSFTARTLTAGDGTISITAATSSGTMTVNSASTLSFNQFTTTVADMELTAAGSINGTSLNAATALGVTSYAGSIAFATANSGGTQTLHANQNVTFNQLTTTGAGNDPGNVIVNADNGFVLAQTVLVNGVGTQGSVAAHGSASLTAGTTSTGNTLTAATGSASLAAYGLIDWTALTAGLTLGATSTAGSITLATANSGGTEMLHANQNVTFNQLTTTGAGNDPGNVIVNADNGFVLAQTVLVNGVATQGSVAANGLASLTAGTTITGNTLTAATGSASLTANGLIDWTALRVATTLAMTSTTDSIIFTAANSGGTETLHAHKNVSFNQIATTGTGNDPGNVTVNADNGYVLAQTVAAKGSASLTAGTTITGHSLTATTGSASLTANGLIDWTALTAGTTFGATSTTDAITLATASSGGTQTLHANQNVTFNQLTTTGIPGDGGNVDVTSDRAAISGGSIKANGSANLIAATNNTGINLTTVTGSASLQAGGLIDWANLNVHRALMVTSTGSGITLGTATSGGTQTLHAAGDIVFTNLTTTGIPGDAGDVNLTSDFGSLRGGSIFANGDPHLTGNNSISLDQLRGNTISLSTPNDLTLNFVSVVRELDLAANTIQVTGTQIPSVPSIPLIMNVTGYKGGVAKFANIDIDPLALVFNQFRVVDAIVVADAPSISIVNGYVPGQLMLTTPTEFILLDNRSPAPSAWPTLQLYQPGGVFTLSQNVNADFTDSYVVFYTGDIASTVSTYSSGHACCSDFTGSSMVRDIPNQTQGTETIDTWLAQKSGAETFYLLGIAGGFRIDASQIAKSVETIGAGPAVNIEGLSESKKFRRLEHQTRKGARPGWRSGELHGNTQSKSSIDQFANAR